MALWFPIMVNNIWVGQVELVIISPVDHQPGDNEVCTYKLKYFDQQYATTPAVQDTIEFPYQRANPIPLLSAALERIKLSV